MTRRWRDSAARARAYARPERKHGALRGTAVRLELMRRARGGGSGTTQVALHTHIRIGVAIHPAATHHTLLRERAMHERSSTLRQVVVRQSALRTTVRHLPGLSWAAPPATPTGAPRHAASRGVAPQVEPQPRAPAPGAPMLRERTRTITSLTRLLHRQRHWRERLVALLPAPLPAAVRVRQRTTHVQQQRAPQASPPTPWPLPATAAPRPATLRVLALPAAEHRFYHERTVRSHTLHSASVRTLLRRAPVPPGRRAARAPVTAVGLPRALRLELVPQRAPALRAARAFAAQAQPLAAAAPPAAAVAPPPVERIEHTLRESMTKVVERTVRHEVERVLRPDAQLGRRLRERIHAEMYDDIVFERERLGVR